MVTLRNQRRFIWGFPKIGPNRISGLAFWPIRETELENGETAYLPVISTYHRLHGKDCYWEDYYPIENPKSYLSAWIWRIRAIPLILQGKDSKFIVLPF